MLIYFKTVIYISKFFCRIRMSIGTSLKNLLIYGCFAIEPQVDPNVVAPLANRMLCSHPDSHFNSWKAYPEEFCFTYRHDTQKVSCVINVTKPSKRFAIGPYSSYLYVNSLLLPANIALFSSLDAFLREAQIEHGLLHPHGYSAPIGDKRAIMPPAIPQQFTERWSYHLPFAN